MRRLLVLSALLAVAGGTAATASAAWPPVCIEKHLPAVTVVVNCGVHACLTEVVHECAL